MPLISVSKMALGKWSASLNFEVTCDLLDSLELNNTEEVFGTGLEFSAGVAYTAISRVHTRSRNTNFYFISFNYIYILLSKCIWGVCLENKLLWCKYLNICFWVCLQGVGFYYCSLIATNTQWIVTHWWSIYHFEHNVMVIHVWIK